MSFASDARGRARPREPAAELLRAQRAGGRPCCRSGGISFRGTRSATRLSLTATDGAVVAPLFQRCSSSSGASPPQIRTLSCRRAQRLRCAISWSSPREHSLTAAGAKRSLLDAERAVRRAHGAAARSWSKADPAASSAFLLRRVPAVRRGEQSGARIPYRNRQLPNVDFAQFIVIGIMNDYDIADKKRVQKSEICGILERSGRRFPTALTPDGRGTRRF